MNSYASSEASLVGASSSNSIDLTATREDNTSNLFLLGETSNVMRVEESFQTLREFVSPTKKKSLQKTKTTRVEKKKQITILIIIIKKRHHKQHQVLFHRSKIQVQNQDIIIGDITKMANLDTLKSHRNLVVFPHSRLFFLPIHNNQKKI